MVYANHLPELEDITRELRPAAAYVRGDPKTQYWIKHGIVFYGEMPVQGADSTTFRCWISGYGADARRVFRYGTHDRTLAAESFRCYSLVYHGDAQSVRTPFGGAIAGADVATFQALDTGYDPIAGGEVPFLLQATGYGKDRARVYWCQLGAKGMHVVKADPASFQAVCTTFGLDDRNVFSGRSSLPKADPKTWRRIGGAYSTDGTRVYYANRLIAGADADTFKAYATRIDMFLVASDKFRYYHWDQPISKEQWERELS